MRENNIIAIDESKRERDKKNLNAKYYIYYIYKYYK